MSGTFITILSNDYKLKLALYEKNRQEPGFVTDIASSSIQTVQAKFVKNVPNVLVLDTEAYNIDQKLIKALMEKYMLYVIAIGKRLVYGDPAIQFVMKPSSTAPEGIIALAAVLSQKIKSIANKAPVFTFRDINNFVDVKQKLIVMGSSTGGTEALPVILSELPGDTPPVVIVQHMPSMFTKQFADRIDKMSIINVKEAQNGEFLKRGTAYIAPGDLHTRLVVRQQRLALECFFGDKMHGVRPAADILFDSVSRISGQNAIGVILTGMGSDGARGLLEMRKKGAFVIGQDKDSCVVYGMPKAAFELGAVDVQVPLCGVAKKLTELCKA